MNELAVPHREGATIALWLDGRPEDTVRTYERDIADFFLVVEPRRLADVQLADLQGYRRLVCARYVDRDGEPNATARRKLASVKALFSWAHKMLLLDRNVATAIELPKGRNRLHERIVLQETMIGAIHTAKPKERALLRFLYGTGARLRELQRLRWRDVTVVDGRGMVSLFGKGKRTRRVPFSAATYGDVIAELRCGAEDDAPVFRGRAGAPMSVRAIERMVKRVAIANGLPHDMTPHWFRHAFGSHALDNGAPIHLVSRDLGHSGLGATTVYAHANPASSASSFLKI